MFPGGGYSILAYDWEGIDIAKWLNSKGIAAFVVKNRLPDDASSKVGHLSPFLDARRAMRLVRFHAKEFNIDINKIGVMGFSAGGHLAATLTTHYDEDIPSIQDSIALVDGRPDFSILVYPVITMQFPYTHEGSRVALLGGNPTAELVELYSNETQVIPNTPPTILIHASDDTAVPVQNSLLFYEALIRNGVAAEMHIYPSGGHGFSLAVGDHYLRTWTDRVVAWMDNLEK
ncbi:MAG: acetyl esterase/lipase [Saprospiraceae bacterium]